MLLNKVIFPTTNMLPTVAKTSLCVISNFQIQLSDYIFLAVQIILRWFWLLHFIRNFFQEKQKKNNFLRKQFNFIFSQLTWFLLLQHGLFFKAFPPRLLNNSSIFNKRENRYTTRKNHIVKLCVEDSRGLNRIKSGILITATGEVFK